MSDPEGGDRLGPIFDGFRQDYFLVWLEGYGLYCIPNFVAREQGGELVLYLLAHVTEEDLVEIRRRLAGVQHRIAQTRLTTAEIEAATGFRIGG